MSTEPPCRSLAQYVTGLVVALDGHDPSAGWRLRQMVTDRSAVLVLDDERVRVTASAGAIVVSDDADGHPADGLGLTDRPTVLDLLDGTLEVSAAVLSGRLQARGSHDDVVAMFTAIEIVLDAASRSPVLQSLADDFRRDPCRPIHQPRFGTADRPSWLAMPPGEERLLADLDLLPARRDEQI